MVPNKENMDNDQTVQSHSHARQPLQPHTYVQEHCPGETGLPSSVFQAVLTRFPIDSLDFLTVVRELFPFASQKTDAITFPAADTTLAFFGGEKEGCFHCIDCRLVSKWWTQHSSRVRKRSRGWICFKKCHVRLRYDQPLLMSRQKPWHPHSGNHRHAKSVVHNVFYILFLGRCLQH